MQRAAAAAAAAKFGTQKREAGCCGEETCEPMSREMPAQIAFECIADLQEPADRASEAAAIAPLTLQDFKYDEHACNCIVSRRMMCGFCDTPVRNSGQPLRTQTRPQILKQRETLPVCETIQPAERWSNAPSPAVNQGHTTA